MPYKIKDEGDVLLQMANAHVDVLDELSECLTVLREDPIREGTAEAFGIHSLKLSEDDHSGFTIGIQNGFISYRVVGHDVILMRYTNPYEEPENRPMDSHLSSTEYEKFEDLTRRLAQVSKDEVDELDAASKTDPSDNEQGDDEQAQDQE